MNEMVQILKQMKDEADEQMAMALPYIELKPEKHLAKVCLPEHGTGKYGQNLGPYSLDGIGYVKYTDIVQTDDASFPTKIVPLVDCGRIFCNVETRPNHRVTEEYNASTLIEAIREATKGSSHKLILKQKDDARAARLALLEEKFGDFNFEDDSNDKEI